MEINNQQVKEMHTRCRDIIWGTDELGIRSKTDATQKAIELMVKIYERNEVVSTDDIERLFILWKWDVTTSFVVNDLLTEKNMPKPIKNPRKWWNILK